MPIKTKKENDIDTLLDDLGIDLNIDKTAHKLRENNLILSDEEIEILERHNIDYKQYNSVESLIFAIENYIADVQGYIEITDIDNLSSTLSEYNYYNNTNK